MYKRSARPKGDNNGTSVNLVYQPLGADDCFFGTSASTGKPCGADVPPAETSVDGAGPISGPIIGAWNQDQLSTGTTTTASDFKVVGGVCKPTNFPALELAKELQRQLNRVAKAKGFTRVVVDGAIGSGTLVLFKQVQGLTKGSLMGDPSSCMGVAPDVDILGVQAKEFADSINAPADGGGPISLTPPTIVNPATGQTASKGGLAGGVLDAFNGMGTIEKIAVAGALGAAAYFAFGKKRRK